MLTADQAKQVLLELIKARPDAFIGSPDPDKLAKLSLEKRAEGKYAFGAFVTDLTNRRYYADTRLAENERGDVRRSYRSISRSHQ